MDNFFSAPLFKLDQLNSFMIVGVAIFLFLTLIYSFKFMRGRRNLLQYYTYIILSGIAAMAAVFSNNLILLLLFWGFLGFTLYLLINMGDENSAAVAKKTLVIVGGTDALMILGLSLIYYFTQTMQMDQIRLELNNHWLILAYICVAIGCFAKAGAIPFHSWVPDCAKSAPVPVVAFLPAALDKLLGIYLLARLSLNLFIMNEGIKIFLMSIGAVTIIAAVMMALVQHNLKKLLGYHAVSQVGYMVLGIGTGNPIGIAGGLFHMLNNTIYKSCLFFSAGNVEYRAKTTELDALGGLAKLMPLTYISCLIASLSISGIPPFNGFVSKWLIYQGLVLDISAAKFSAYSIFTIFCLIAAMFGSALTLASFMKLLHATFFGSRTIWAAKLKINEVSWLMWLPGVILAVICILFGVFAFVLPLKYFIFPVVSLDASALLGSWSPVLAMALILVGLFFGFIVFKLSTSKLITRSDSAFVGGEAFISGEENAVTGVEFYNTVSEMGLLRRIYRLAEAGVFDLYEQGKKIFSISKVFQYLHNGVLPTYLTWIILGMAGLIIILVR